MADIIKENKTAVITGVCVLAAGAAIVAYSVSQKQERKRKVRRALAIQSKMAKKRHQIEQSLVTLFFNEADEYIEEVASTKINPESMKEYSKI